MKNIEFVVNHLCRFSFILVFVSASSLMGQPDRWTETSFQDFVDGTFDDRGANTYVSARGRIQTINRWDLNQDGHIDLVFCNTHPLIEALDLTLYWGNGRDFSPARQSHIPVDGAQSSAPADLNGDGTIDLAIANYSNGTWTEMDSFVYYGTQNKREDFTPKDWGFFPFDRKVSLPSTSAQAVATGDLNRDGHLDIVFAFSAGHWEYRTNRDQEYTSPSRIFWGSEEGFSRDHFQDLPAQGATDVAVGDLNGDGWMEVAFANASRSGETDIDSYIYWGSEKGFSAENRTGLSTLKASSIEFADIDSDGDVDIVFCNESGSVSYGYLNDSGAFESDNRMDFETHAPKDSAVADFNNDGFSDIFFSNHTKNGNRITDSFLYFGSAEGFSTENRMAFETIGAWGVNASDLNHDGWIDLFVSNFQEHYSYEVPSYVFWNSEGGFDNSRRTPLFEHGATGNSIADFDGDGHLDILVHSFSGRSRGDYDDNYIYWGNEKGKYLAENRLELPGRDNYEYAAADLNDDDYVDLVFANSGEASRRANENWVYWNGPDSFSNWNISGLPAYLSLGVQAADLDRNGWIDIIICNFGVDPRTGDPVSYICWGEEQGFVISDRTEIPHVARACSIADLNEDGHLDLVFGAGAKRWAPEQKDSAVIFWGKGTREFSLHHADYIEATEGSTQPEVADLNKDGHLDLVLGNSGVGGMADVLFGDGSGGFSGRMELPVESSSTLSIGDLNGDGWLDIAFPSYKAKGPPVSRSTQSRIYWGGPSGFDPENLQKLPTHSAAGTLISDFNSDGLTDLFFYNHRQEGNPNRVGSYGDHLTDSFLYWGTTDGFKPEQKDLIPSLGVHNDSGVDIGHIENRGFEFGYTSSPYALKGKSPSIVSWRAIEPPHTSVRFQLRFAETAEDLDGEVWMGPDGEGSFYTESDEKIVGASGEWMQYRAVLDTGNGAISPVLEDVTIEFE